MTYRVILDRKIGAPGHVQYVVDGLSDLENRYLNENMECISKYINNEMTNIKKFPSAPNKSNVSFSDQFQKNLTENTIIYGKKLRKKTKQG